jgi:hypothetical protein
MTLPSLLRALSVGLLLGLHAPTQAIPLAPQYAGVYLDGDGANSRWAQVAPSWRGGIHGEESWGTGIWGLSDHALVMELPDDAPKLVRTLETRVDQIDFGDQYFIDTWGATWGTPELVPLFNGNAQGFKAQDNWAASFWGYVAVTAPGAYNFGVLHDDGFRFSLFGAGDSVQNILADGLNPRDRLGFSEDLLLSPGLYGFQLDAYERLEAGVVQLAWWTPGASDWAVVPKSSLFTKAIPEPSVPVLMLAGLVALGIGSRRLRH